MEAKGTIKQTGTASPYFFSLALLSVPSLCSLSLSSLSLSLSSLSLSLSSLSLSSLTHSYVCYLQRDLLQGNKYFIIIIWTQICLLLSDDVCQKIATTTSIHSTPVFFCVHTLNNPSAHPFYSYHYLLSPSMFFFFLHILLFFAHPIVFCTSYCFALLYCTFYSYFSFFTIYMLLCCVTFI